MVCEYIAIQKLNIYDCGTMHYIYDSYSHGRNIINYTELKLIDYQETLAITTIKPIFCMRLPIIIIILSIVCVCAVIIMQKVWMIVSFKHVVLHIYIDCSVY